MTARTIRRAQERRANKLARKEAQGVSLHPDLPPSASTETLDAQSKTELTPETDFALAPSPARLAANRTNAQRSTGPRTAEGKAHSSINAVKTALTGRTVLLPSDDAALYRHHLERFTEELKPVTARESVLVQSIADTDWRLLRIPALESAIYARGRAENTTAEHSGLADLQTFLQYEKQLRNLQLQEGRLRRHREKDLAELKSLQQLRIAEERRQLEEAAMLYTAARHDGRSFDPADHGFEFSLDDVQAFLDGARAAQLYRNSLKQAKAAA